MPATKIKAKPLTDADLLQLIAAGIIEIDNAFTDPVLIFNGKPRKPELNEQGGRRRIYGSSRWRYGIRWQGRRRNIMRSRLVWLYYFGAIEPDCQIHHARENSRLDDSLFNLEKLTDVEHHERHYGPMSEF